MNNQALEQYMKEKQVTQETMSVVYVIFEVGNGSPVHLLHEYEDEVINAVAEGYVVIMNDKLYLSNKANKMIESILWIAKSERVL